MQLPATTLSLTIGGAALHWMQGHCFDTLMDSHLPDPKRPHCAGTGEKTGKNALCVGRGCSGSRRASVLPACQWAQSHRTRWSNQENGAQIGVPPSKQAVHSLGTKRSSLDIVSHY